MTFTELGGHTSLYEKEKKNYLHKIKIHIYSFILKQIRYLRKSEFLNIAWPYVTFDDL